MDTRKPRLLRAYAYLLLLVFITFAFLTGACRKPGKGNSDDNGDNVQPMYGIKTSIFKVIK